MATRDIVFLPGTLCDRALFEPQIERAEAAGWRARVADYDGFRDLDVWAEHVLARAPARFAVVGLSLGGIAAMALLRRASARVRCVALLDTNPAADTPEGAARRELDFARAERIGLERFIAEEMIPRQLHPDHAGNKELCEIVSGMALRTGMARWRGQLDLLTGRPDARPVLKTLELPVLVGCGDADRVCPPSLHEEMAALIPEAGLEIFPKSGHLPTLEASDVVSEALIGLLSRI